jgi:hypothetical protein
LFSFCSCDVEQVGERRFCVVIQEVIRRIKILGAIYGAENESGVVVMLRIEWNKREPGVSEMKFRQVIMKIIERVVYCDEGIGSNKIFLLKYFEVDVFSSGIGLSKGIAKGEEEEKEEIFEGFCHTLY